MCSYSVENNRGHDDYTIDPYDFFDTYVAQYRRAFAISNATGVMCRCVGVVVRACVCVCVFVCIGVRVYMRV